MEKDVMIEAFDGGSFSAFVTYPASDLPAPAVVVAQEIFGVNDVMRDICRQLAETGYIAICPDLFWRQEADIQLTDQSEDDWARAFELFQGFDIDKGVEDMKSALAHIRDDNSCTGRAGTLGYCLGGKIAYLMATRSNSDCAVSYYGVGIEEMLEESSNISQPLLMHIAEKDEYVPLDAQEKILRTLKSHEHIALHVYSGVDHAFARKGGAHYDKEAAHQANSRTADFLASFLSSEEHGE